MNKQDSDASLAVWNVPNVLSMIRLGLSLLLFAILPAGWYWTALVLFAIAAGTDWIDGWWARKFNQVTQLGRILDPFCDKVLICGVFILLAEAMVDSFPWYVRITGWMAVVVVARELLVTGLRSFLESAGTDFSAKMAGKLKMVFQCAAAVTCLWMLARQAASPSAADGAFVWDGLAFAAALSIWLSLFSTVYSGWLYAQSAARMLGRGE